MSDLTPAQVELLGRIADVLFASSTGAPVPTELEAFPEWIRRAAHARSRDVDRLGIALAAIEPDDIDGSLRRLETMSADDYELIASISAGAYTMHPVVMAAVGYPEERRAPIPFDQSANELSSGILDPVLASDRPFLRAAPD